MLYNIEARREKEEFVTNRQGYLRTIEPWEIAEGAPAPLGVTWVGEHRAFNFALYSRYGTGVTLLLYTAADLLNPVYQLRLSHLTNKTGRVWHCWVSADVASEARYYAYRVDGPAIPDEGLRFDPMKILLDPYAHEVFFPPDFSRTAAASAGPNDGRAPLGVLPSAEDRFVWADAPPPRHNHDAIVYELHVRGFTAHPNSGLSPEQRGTFAGLTSKIPYLQDLGVTIVELLPVHQCDPQEGSYWGYMTLNFFAPQHSYAAGDPRDEFRAMVKAFHAAGIQVWLDVVYNHTTEGDERGPTYSYRGIDNRSYYLLARDRRAYLNEAGCGNTLLCADEAVRSLILSSLRMWVNEMHIDGFRFDLASIMTRNADGSVNTVDPALISEISEYARARDVTVVAEAWDIGAYLLGQAFPGLAWLQWNGKFRDDMRAFVKGDRGRVPDLMRRLYGSDDLFPDTLADTCRPSQSVNFVTAHDGFCLYDLTAYNQKHNWVNGHGNTDGTDDNLSWNCGWEGDQGAQPDVHTLRRRQVRNFFTLLMLANGTPMFCAGDEFLNTQYGNNNPYNQDNEISWLDWENLERNADVHRFFKLMITFRKAHPSIHRSRFWREDVRWYGARGQLHLADDLPVLAYALDGARVGDDDLYVMINAYWHDLTFQIHEGVQGDWLRAVDTARVAPFDICVVGAEDLHPYPEYLVSARSVVVLIRRRERA